MNILSPFNKIKYEDFSLTTDANFSDLVTRVFGKLKVENTNNASKIPFPKMSQQDIAVWEAYCPHKRKLGNL